MKPQLMVALALGSVCLLICETVSLVSAAQPDIEAGRMLYMTKGCFECHGPVGQGSIMSGPALAPSPPPVEAINTYVRTPKGQMPLYSGNILSDRDVLQIHAYLASIPPSPSPDSLSLLGGQQGTAQVNADAPLPSGLSAQRGQHVFAKRCASCHGVMGSGGVGPSLIGVVARRGQAGVESFVRNPSGAMPKLYPDALTELDVRAVAEYVAGLR
jgi:ubiquinol-cytochrome c reductase cytochrome c subunit